MKIYILIAVLFVSSNIYSQKLTESYSLPFEKENSDNTAFYSLDFDTTGADFSGIYKDLSGIFSKCGFKGSMSGDNVIQFKKDTSVFILILVVKYDGSPSIPKEKWGMGTLMAGFDSNKDRFSDSDKDFIKGFLEKYLFDFRRILLKNIPK